MIQSFEYGKIVIDNQEYTYDIIIIPDGTIHKWWRFEGHMVARDDLKMVLDDPPDVLIIGAGTNGRMSLPPGLRQYLIDKGIEVEYQKTDRAIELYNQRDPSKKTVLALHITC